MNGAVLLPEGLQALKRVAKTGGLTLTGAYLNLDAGVESTHHRTGMFNAGMIPNLPDNLAIDSTRSEGRKRVFNDAIHD